MTSPRRPHPWPALLGGALAGALILLAVVAALALLPPPGSAQATTDIDAGRQLFDMHCAMCHGQDASGMMGMHPSLRGAVDRLTREGVEITIRRGRDTQPPMPAFADRMTDEEIDTVVDYIASLPHGPRNFGPGAGMMDGVTSGSATAMWAVLALLAALLAALVGGLVGFLIGRRR